MSFCPHCLRLWFWQPCRLIHCSPAQPLGLRRTSAGRCFLPHIACSLIGRRVPILAALAFQTLSTSDATFAKGAGEQCAAPNAGIASQASSWRFCPGIGELVVMPPSSSRHHRLCPLNGTRRCNRADGSAGHLGRIRHAISRTFWHRCGHTRKAA